MAVNAFFQVHAIVGLFIFCLMTLLWVISLLIKDTSIVDIFWGFGFVISVWIAFLLTQDMVNLRHLLIAILTTVWGMRLSLHIFFRNKGKGEDFRYQNWRKQYGKNWWWVSFLQTFLLQGLLMWIIAAPLTAAQFYNQRASLIVLDVVGAFLWLIGFVFESLGDLQLIKFKGNPANKGKVLDSGVWRYTRHPNYFGDAAQWWGFYLIALAAGGWWTVFSPILMTYLLVKVSGVALLEKSMIANKPGYREYAQRTSAFIPWFPKNE